MAQEERRIVTIPFFGTVAPNSGKTLVSKRISVPFKIKEIACSFAPGVNRLMTLEFYISPDPSAPTSKPLTGTNILASLGHVGYLTGDDERKQQRIELEVPQRGYYLKVFADNKDSYEHTIDAQITIELIYKRSEEKKPEE